MIAEGLVHGRNRLLVCRSLLSDFLLRLVLQMPEEDVEAITL